eukprot:m.180335 g.180335  ORF g.180335 m.180335 type:complete len:463 (+) comp18413_c0_seq2:271-1659(+)
MQHGDGNALDTLLHHTDAQWSVEQSISETSAHYEADLHTYAYASNVDTLNIKISNPTETSPFRQWARKYLCDGQMLNDGPHGATDRQKRRNTLAIALPIAIVWVAWWPYMIASDNWSLFSDTNNGSSNYKPRWVMSITMVFGSIVAGATSEGGAAIAFPVMTLVLGISTRVARDFSLMIQSIGMVAAASTIFVMGVRIEVNSLYYTTCGGVVGIIFGLEIVSPALSPAFAKMIFVGFITAYAVALFSLNSNMKRKTHTKIVHWRTSRSVDGGAPKSSDGCWRTPSCNWASSVLVATGFIGGIFTGISGSGIDICSFAVLTLLFRVSEKVAMPTSVVLMAINTAFGFAYIQVAMGGVARDAWGFWIVCIPIVVIGAPLGSVVGTHFHRLTLAALVYVIDSILFTVALVVVKPWLAQKNGGKTEHPAALCITTMVVLGIGSLFFHWLSYKGLQLLLQCEAPVSS